MVTNIFTPQRNFNQGNRICQKRPLNTSARSQCIIESRRNQRKKRVVANKIYQRAQLINNEDTLNRISNLPTQMINGLNNLNNLNDLYNILEFFHGASFV
ncbi:1687_t:CDS:1 [Funneliformis geosporum]|uniref:10142_t:CDS:1 n=1 Tax=Funneliformis geosporum TaxID=1117311 RepID=A0A9W4SIC3_9GLOM|nr:10142_t:CDS:1 [Funneliformis geosporum]CAI2172906.1 1687_t:CDS:1 [Funneliformis geosporum]